MILRKEFFFNFDEFEVSEFKSERISFIWVREFKVEQIHALRELMSARTYVHLSRIVYWFSAN